MSRLLNPEYTATFPAAVLAALDAWEEASTHEQHGLFVRRFVERRCIVVEGFCITHRAVADIGHALDIDPSTSTD